MQIRNRVWKIAIKHALVLTMCFFVAFVYKCPFNYFLHIPCPGCGITRAYIAAVSLDFSAAFGYHPLFFTVAPVILYIAHRDALKRRLSKRAELICFGVLISLFVCVYIFRMLWGDYSQT